MRNFLFYSDLVTLFVMREACETKKGLIMADWPNEANQWLKKNSVPANYAVAFSHSDRHIRETCTKLKDLGLISDIGHHSGWCATEKASALFASFDPDWREWPLAIPVRNGKLVMDEAKYASEFRKEL